MHLIRLNILYFKLDKNKRQRICTLKIKHFAFFQINLMNLKITFIYINKKHNVLYEKYYSTSKKN